jgi:FkbM family methyltransferase
MPSEGSVVDSGDTDVFVLTRFGIGVTDEDWLATRLRLFEAITLPSLRAQTDQRFHWLIFVGPEAQAWVVSRLQELCRPLGERLVLIRSILRPQEIRRAVLEHRRGAYMISALIDDDDAWHVRTVEWARETSIRLRGEGLSKFGFTFRAGYEWLISDLVDVDRLVASGKKVIRQSAVYHYVRPFLGTSCFTFSRHEDCFEKIGGLHASVGQNLLELGFASRVLDAPEPAWLYVRHHQADSSIHKASSEARAEASLADLVRTFGVDEQLVRAYQAESGSMRYAAKRTHKRSDKSSLTFEIDALAPQSPRAGEPLPVHTPPPDYVIQPRLEHGVEDERCRLAVYDYEAKQFCYFKVVPSDQRSVISADELPRHGDCKYKIQVRRDGKWRDHTGYLPLRPRTDGGSEVPNEQAKLQVLSHSLEDQALYNMDLQLLQTSALLDVGAAEQRKASNEALAALFLKLNAIVRPDVIFEIGACDAAFSCQVRSRAPEASIFAFEANPHNFGKFGSRPELRDSRVQYLHLAVTDHDGEASFFIQKSRAGKAISLNTGGNSMLERLGNVEQERITVPAVSIAQFASAKRLTGIFSAWVDVEGAIKQALLGMRERIADFSLLLCEVEERQHWKDQWLWLDVLSFLSARGFMPIARDFEYTTQHNVVFVRRELMQKQEVRRAVAEHYSSLRHVGVVEAARRAFT